MEIKFDDYERELNKQVNDYELAYGDMLDKVLNENMDSLHTMLVKSDFENYVQFSNTVFTETKESEYADLSDLINYEKELTKHNGNETR